jgi:putative inorganic carbon (hco3(-)) transporter
MNLSKTNTKRQRPDDLANRVFVQDKLYNWLGFLFVVSLAAFFGYLFAKQMAAGLSLLAFVVGFFVFLVCLVSSEVGLFISVVYSFSAFHFSRYFFNDEFPVGVILDFLLFATFLGLLKDGRKFKRVFGQFIKSPVSIMITVLLGFLFLQFFNFQGHSFEGWLQSFRRFLGSVFLLFIAYYQFDDIQRIKRFFTLIFIAALVTGIYGCIQEWFGLFEFERWWVISNENRFGLYFIMGDFRKFSTMSDPASYGITMAICAIFFVITAYNTNSTAKKIGILTGAMFMILGMSYSGTRTANVMMAGAAVMYVLLSLNQKRTQVFAVLATLVFLFFMYGPYVNSTIIRFRTSFQSEDASFQVRDINRKAIQPYIKRHPLGGGLGTSGAAGLRFNRGHYLSGFPPDSGYLRKAMETGWIGLGLTILVYFVIMRSGIRSYFKSRRAKLKVLYAAALAAIFSLYIGEFAQEAIGQISDIVVYYPLIALIMQLGNKEDELEKLLRPEAEPNADN